MRDATSAAVASAEPLVALQRKPRSLWGDALRRLAANKGALIGVVVFVVILLMAVGAPWLAPFDPVKLNPIDSLQPPSARHWMGTDQFGRDVLSRVIYGSRTSVAMGFVAVAISVTAGSVLGLISGYYLGAADMVVMRLVDVMLAFPGILLALVIIAILGPNLVSAMIAVGISGMPVFIRVVRGSVLTLRETEYIEAARVIGCRNARIIARHILPNALAPIIVLATLGIPSAIISGAALSFLGLGIKPPTPDWGAMLSNGKDFVSSAWWLTTFPGIALLLLVMAINLFGDGLRDALDPRLKL
ncbi:ABC transporter permease [Sphaerobacter sp.]|uniref:ABC transporter permease n=1 Tax=Sphaerobacter sp. TaxID=2099654 RepID=UPI001DE9AAAE|nr:ABC transporter permease [Sphaerobacter sp.]MBX5446181.1 ABC transporter permease [Sphaerobacter sp.]